MKAPLGFDNVGNPIDVPEAAASWRVRRALGRPGRPQTVYDPDTGRQLELPITATLDDLRECGCPPARYRLEAIDGDGKALVPAVVGFVELVTVDDDDEAEERAPRAVSEREIISSDRAMKTIERQAEALARTVEALARAFGPVHPAPDSAADIVQHLAAQPSAAAPPAMNLASVLTPENIQALGLVGQQIASAWNAVKASQS